MEAWPTMVNERIPQTGYQQGNVVHLSMMTLSFATIQHRFEHRLAEWGFAFAMLLCGLVLLSGPTFDLPPYAVISQFAPQATWGWALSVIGAVRLVVLVINGAMKRGSPHLRCAFSFVSAIIWSILLVGFWAFELLLLVEAFLAVAVVIEGINTFRAAQDARSEDDACGGGNAGRTAS